jgi:hypothetical protein
VGHPHLPAVLGGRRLGERDQTDQGQDDDQPARRSSGEERQRAG